MSRARIRILLAAALVATNLLVLVGPIHAQGNTVTGTLQLVDTVTLSRTAVAVITLTDRSKDGAGTIIGQQRIDGATGNDAFSVQFDPAAINTKHAYSIYASVIDGDTQLQNPDPVPTITGGPLDGLVVPVSAAAYQTPASITGTIALPSDVTLTPTAVAYAAILDATTGRLVSRQVIASLATLPAPFTVGYDAALVNPADSYVASAAVIDGATLYQAKSTTPIAPGATFDLTVAATGTVIPVPGASESPGASAGASESPVTSEPPGASETPGASPTEEPSVTPRPTRSPRPTQEPTATPTEAPTATPTEAPTATPAPTEAPTASPTAVPSESAQPSESVAPSASPSIGPITVTGQATYPESWQLTDQAVLTVNVIQVDPNGPSVVAVGQTEMTNPGQVPISFSVPLDMSLLAPTTDAFLYATLIDGKEAWTVASGIKVATNGNPTDNVQVPLVFRPDLIEGNVTGAFIDLPPDISPQAWAAVALLNKSDGTVLGFQSGPLLQSTAAFPFAVPFLIANVDADKDYVAIGNVFDGPRKFQSQAEPVITQGNPYENVILNSVQVAPSPAPSAEASASAAPSAAAPSAAATATVHPVATASPSTSTGSGGGVDPLLLAGVAGLVVIGLIVVVAVLRR